MKDHEQEAFYFRMILIKPDLRVATKNNPSRSDDSKWYLKDIKKFLLGIMQRIPSDNMYQAQPPNVQLDRSPPGRLVLGLKPDRRSTT
jgi:hypothetical protein